MTLTTFYHRHDLDIPAYFNKRMGKDAGYDLFAAEDVWVYPLQTKSIPTNAFIHIPKGHFGQVSGRSGNTKRGWFLHTGIVDHGYSGQIGAITTNFAPWPRRIRKGERIAQLIFVPFTTVLFDQEVYDDAQYEAMVYTESNSERKKKAYNSSGK